MHPHSPHPILGVIVLGLFFAGVMSALLTTADFSPLLKQIGEALRQACLAMALRDPNFSQKTVYEAMGYSKGQWSKVLSGEGSISLARLHRAPLPFYIEAFQRLVAIKVHEFAWEKVNDARESQRVA